MIEEAEVSAQVVRGQHLQSNDRPRVALTNSQERLVVAETGSRVALICRDCLVDASARDQRQALLE